MKRVAIALVMVVGVVHADTRKQVDGAPAGGGLATPTDPTQRSGPAKETITSLDVKGKLGKNVVRRLMHRSYQRLLFCYDKEQRAYPTLQGTVSSTFTIDEHGAVSDASASGLENRAVEDCVKRVLQSIEFPVRESGSVRVTAKIRYEPPPPAAVKPRKAKRPVQRGSQIPR